MLEELQRLSGVPTGEEHPNKASAASSEFNMSFNPKPQQCRRLQSTSRRKGMTTMRTRRHAPIDQAALGGFVPYGER